MKLKELLKDQSGKVLVFSMGYLLFILLLSCPIYVFAQCSAQIAFVKDTSQNALDVYTVKTGKDIMSSIKNGYDYTDLLNEQRFVSELKSELDFSQNNFVGVDNKGKEILRLSNIKASFIFDKSLKTEVKYTVTYQFYFLSKPVFTKDFNVVQESQYNLKGVTV